MCLGAEVSPEMPRMKSKAVPEGNGLFPQDEAGSAEPTIAGTHRASKEGFNRMDKHLEKVTGMLRRTNQRLAGMQHQA